MCWIYGLPERQHRLRREVWSVPDLVAAFGRRVVVVVFVLRCGNETIALLSPVKKTQLGEDKLRGNCAHRLVRWSWIGLIWGSVLFSTLRSGYKPRWPWVSGSVRVSWLHVWSSNCIRRFVKTVVTQCEHQAEDLCGEAVRVFLSSSSGNVGKFQLELNKLTAATLSPCLIREWICFL